jgi:hypothetical protein
MGMAGLSNVKEQVLLYICQLVRLLLVFLIYLPPNELPFLCEYGWH